MNKKEDRWLMIAAAVYLCLMAVVAASVSPGLLAAWLVCAVAGVIGARRW
jgi:hypothetical protein